MKVGGILISKKTLGSRTRGSFVSCKNLTSLPGPSVRGPQTPPEPRGLQRGAFEDVRGEAQDLEELG